MPEQSQSGPKIPETYRRLEHSEHPHSEKSTPAGAVDANEPITVTLIVRRRPGAQPLRIEDFTKTASSERKRSGFHYREYRLFRKQGAAIGFEQCDGSSRYVHLGTQFPGPKGRRSSREPAWRGPQGSRPMVRQEQSSSDFGGR